MPKKRGRPPLADDVRRSKELRVRLTNHNFDTITWMAETAGTTKTNLILVALNEYLDNHRSTIFQE